MKHLRKYNESKITTLDSLSDDELKEKLEWLSVEYHEIQEQMVDIRKILTKREEERQRDYSKDLPKSIYDFNKEQLEWIFEHHHGTTSEHYKIATDYFRQLKGMVNTGFNQNTNQFYFNINCYSLFNEAEDGFRYDPEVGKALVFLGENLKKNNGFVEFGITYAFAQGYYDDRVIYVASNDIRYKQGWGSVDMRRGRSYGTPELLLEKIVEHDLSEKDNVSW